VLAVAWFAAIAAGLTAPLLRDPARTLFGRGLGDNAAGVWAFWWAQRAVADPARGLWQTDALFAPIGTRLVLNTGTPLLTVSTAVALPDASPVLAYNTWCLLGLFLNGLCAGALAFAYTRRRVASLVAGTAFALAPFLIVRLDGHLNVLQAWPLPLVALCAVRWLRRPALARGVALGAAAAATFYIDYSYGLFGVGLLAILAAGHRWPVQVVRRPPTPWRRRLAIALASLAAVALVAALAIWWSGGAQVALWGRTVSLRGTFNLRLGGWLAAVAAALTWWGPSPRVMPAGDAPARERANLREWTRAGAIVAGTAALLLAPLAIQGYRMWAAGDYVSQRYRWRSAPGGLDVASLVLPNPDGWLLGAAGRAAQARAGVDPIEGAAWLGIVPIALAAIAVARWRRRPLVRTWVIAAAVFGVWSLGPFLTVLGRNTGFILPQAFARAVPLLANAREPERAFVIVILAVALLGAFAIARTPRLRRGVMAPVLLVLLVVDLWPAARPTVTVDRPSIDATLAALPAGIVLPVPLGIRDGFGEAGRLAHAELYYQTLHGHPLAGGFVARLSPRITRAYETDAVFGPLLAASADRPGPPMRPATSGDTLACGVRYVIWREGASPAARALVASVFRLRPIASAGGAALYEVVGYAPPFCAGNGAPRGPP
jgi:hypothetical protein